MSAARTYSIVRSHRDKDGVWEKIVASGLNWLTAKDREEQLNKTERAAHPNETSWTRDLFLLVLEGSREHKKLLEGQNAQRQR